VAAVTRWEPEAVNRKGLQVTKGLEASPPLKNWRWGVRKGHAKLQEHKTGAWKLCHPGTLLAQELFTNTCIRCSSFTGIII
jgi:hypothetical protein